MARAVHSMQLSLQCRLLRCCALPAWLPHRWLWPCVPGCAGRSACGCQAAGPCCNRCVAAAVLPVLTASLMLFQLCAWAPACSVAHAVPPCGRTAPKRTISSAPGDFPYPTTVLHPTVTVPGCLHCADNMPSILHGHVWLHALSSAVCNALLSLLLACVLCSLSGCTSVPQLSSRLSSYPPCVCCVSSRWSAGSQGVSGGGCHPQPAAPPPYCAADRQLP